MKRKQIMGMAAAALVSAATVAQAGTVEGTVGYRERIAPPPGAVVEVELLDVSRADAKSLTLSSQRYALTGVPHSFSLSYDDALIDGRYSYVVAAKILLDERVLWRSTTAHPVLTRGAGNTVDVMLEKMPASPPPAPLDNTQWRMFEMKGRMMVAERLPEISFAEEGAFGLGSGCNQFSGKAEIDGDSFAFPDKMAGTLMLCPPPNDKIESDLLETLPLVTGYVMSGDQLAFVNAAGVTVMRFQRVTE